MNGASRIGVCYRLIVVGVNTLMELLALRDEGICVSVLNPPLYEGGWKHVDGLYPPEIEAALKAIPSSRGGGPNGEPG